ncbi:MAG: LptF/LptG family permease [Cyclobacteriaceae bacterium]|nr:LptF/LptG family permease [Cyclobacteriaceae bacterium]
MKKLDKLILASFLGPFFLTFVVVVFILLLQFMLKYFEELVGKDLGWEVYVQLIFYFSINMTTNAFPLAVLLSSLMTYGNLGEHSEITAIKSAGISLVRTLVPIFFFSILLTIAAYYNNNYIVPKANLEAFSLLYDIKQKKPSMELKEGSFYNGIPGFSIKVNKKYPDEVSLGDLIIYDHTASNGNKDIILADSGRMYNILNGRYLVFELFNGNRFSEQPPNKPFGNLHENPMPYLRSEFDKTKMVFSLEEFDLKRTRKELFQSNRLMKNVPQLRHDIDSMQTDYDRMTAEVRSQSFQFFKHHLGDVTGKDSVRIANTPSKLSLGGDHVAERKPKTQNEILNPADTSKRRSALKSGLPLKRDIAQLKDTVTYLDDGVYLAENYANDSLRMLWKRDSVFLKRLISDTLISQKVTNYQDLSSLEDENTLLYVDSLYSVVLDTIPPPLTAWEKVDSVLYKGGNIESAYRQALSQVRYVGNNMTVRADQLDRLLKEINLNQIERYKKFAYAFTILAMFLIGAPLGAIIKKGGLGLPVLVSIFFFIVFYVISMTAEKWARQDLISSILAVWLANFVLFPIGLVFLRGARNDIRLFEADFYNVALIKLKNYLRRSKRKIFLWKRRRSF